MEWPFHRNKTRRLGPATEKPNGFNLASMSKSLFLIVILMGAFGQIGVLASQAPSFVVQPQSQNTDAGHDITFSGLASGATPISYQWWFNGSSISGAKDTNLTVLSVSDTNAGTYWLVASNSHGTATSSNAFLIVGHPPTLLQAPISQAAPVNSNAVLTVNAIGTLPLNYQWRLNGQDVGSATNASMNIAAMQSGAAGSYDVIVTNGFGSIVSAAVSLNIASPPAFLWARNVTNVVGGYSGASSADYVAVDASGNVLVAGDYQGSGVDFGGGTLTSASPPPAFGSFVCKYDRWGNFVWAQSLFSSSNVVSFYDRGLRVGADSDGNVYVTGDFTGMMSLGTNALVSTGPTNIFLAKYDAAGDLQWAQQIGAYDPSDNYLRGFTVDRSGNSYILSKYSGTATFGMATISNSISFLAKYDSAGSLRWVEQAPGGMVVAVGADESVYIAGPTTNLYSFSATGVLAKYDGAGNPVWSRPFPRASSIALDPSNNVHTTGIGNGTYGDVTITNVGGLADMFVAKSDPAGNLIWIQQVGSHVEEIGTGVALDGNGNIYVAAGSGTSLSEPGPLQLGNAVLTNANCFVAKYDPAGNALWALPFGTTNSWPAVGVAVVNPGEIYLAGKFYGSAQFGSFNLQMTGLTGNNFYVAKLAGFSPPAPPQIVGQPQDEIIRAGSTGRFEVLVPSELPLSYQWFFNRSNVVPGANASTLVVTNVQMVDAGNYLVRVTNQYGSVTSSPANLTVYLTEAALLSSMELDSGVRFTINGAPGFSYTVESSTNLVNWVPLQTGIAPFICVDTNNAMIPAKFYRAVWAP